MKLSNDFWRKYFKVYDALNELIPYQELLAAFLDPAIKQSDRILDLGSGSGNLAIKFHNKGYSVVGIDLSKEATKRHLQKNPEAKLVIGDITKPLPFQNEEFEAICSNNVIYTLQPEKREALFAELYRILKPEGTIIVSNLNKGFSPAQIYLDHLKKSYARQGLWSTIMTVIKFVYPTILIFWYNYLIKRAHESGYYKFLDHGEQERLLEKAGFKIRHGSTPIYGGQAFIVKAYK